MTNENAATANGIAVPFDAGRLRAHHRAAPCSLKD